VPLSVPGPLVSVVIVVPDSVALAVTVVAVSVTVPIVGPESVADVPPCVPDPSVALTVPLVLPEVGPTCVVPESVALSEPLPLAVPPPSSPQPTQKANPHPTIHLLYTMDRGYLAGDDRDSLRGDTSERAHERARPASPRYDAARPRT
jgi:hypothetical protein